MYINMNMLLLNILINYNNSLKKDDDDEKKNKIIIEGFSFRF